MVKDGKKRRRPRPRRSLIPLFVRVAFVYYIILATVVLLTIRLGTLRAGAAGTLPRDWVNLLLFIYYGLPVFLAFLYGLVFRPFWPSFRNLLVLIVAIHGIYSLGVYSYRMFYFKELKDESYAARMAEFAVFDVRHRILDKTQDGQIDQLDFTAQVDATDFPPGTYRLYATISQKGKTFPDSLFGEHTFVVDPAIKPKPFRIRFFANPQLFEPYYAGGPFDVNIGVEKDIPVSQTGQRLITFSRWAPFLRFTSWDGRDPEVERGRVQINTVDRVASFRIMPLELPSRQVLVWGEQISDEAVDLDGNGRMDGVRITIPLRSEYAGPVFIQTILAGAQYPLTLEREVALGENQLEFMIDWRYLRDLGQDGPYELEDFRLFNEDPHCLRGICPERIKPNFMMDLDNYITQRYRLDDFEQPLS